MRSIFDIDEISGYVTSKKEFDYEKQSQFDVIVKAIDEGGRFGYTLLKVIIEDVNDNNPVFGINEYKYVISTSFNKNKTLFKVNKFIFLIIDKHSKLI